MDATSGNGNITVQERAVTSFEGIMLQSEGTAIIHHAENYKVEVTTDSNIQDIVTIEFKNNVLYIIDQFDINPTTLLIDVYVPELPDMYLQSSGIIRVAIDQAEGITIFHQGSGIIDTAQCEVQTVNAFIQGDGDIKTWAADTLNANISTSGDILYKGNPVINENITKTALGKTKRL